MPTGAVALCLLVPDHKWYPPSWLFSQTPLKWLPPLNPENAAPEPPTMYQRVAKLLGLSSDATQSLASTTEHKESKVVATSSHKKRSSRAQ
jgi:hypothetical protein